MNPDVFEYNEVVDNNPYPKYKSNQCVLDRSWMTDCWYVECTTCEYKTHEHERVELAVEDWVKRHRV